MKSIFSARKNITKNIIVGSSFQALVDTNAMAESDFDLDA
jgi:hypothetical protein